MPKPGPNWREWLGGKPDEAAAAFGPADAKTFAEEMGYQVSGEPVAEKKHFRLIATKEDTSYELDVHRDGKIVERPFFGIAEAKALAASKGYQLTSEPVATKAHFRARGTKDGRSLELDLRRDGSIGEHVLFGPAEAKKFVMEQGYDPVSDAGAVDEHFEVLGKKGDRFYVLDAHRDGKIKARQVDSSDPRWGSQVR